MLLSKGAAVTRRTPARQRIQSIIRMHSPKASRPYSQSQSNNNMGGGAESLGQDHDREGWLFVDSVFPIRLGAWDLRYYIGYLQKESLLEKLGTLLRDVNKHGFRIVSLEPQEKDGGVFIRFKYNADDPDTALNEILLDVRSKAAGKGGVPSWFGLPRGDAWLVKGQPWREDLMRWPSSLVKISFQGPDVDDEILYSILRPYGRMGDITPPAPGPPGGLRSTIVAFRNLRGAVRARNTVHGLFIPSNSSKTRLKMTYEKPIQAHAVRDYVTSHPRIFLPILFFILGTLTYTIFDPIRAFMVEGRLQDWFDYRQSRLYKWLRSNTLDRFSFSQGAQNIETSSSYPASEAWKERHDAQDTLRRYLSDMPNTIAFIYGPQGSGKSRMLNHMLAEEKLTALVIDVGELSKAGTDTALVTALANETGYWPVFSFMNSLNNLIDLASVGIIGQKAGLSSSLSDQLKQILEVVGTGLRRVNTSYKQALESQREHERLEEEREAYNAQLLERIRQGVWHDGRLDCVAGNGVMSELGIGDEWFTPNDADPQFDRSAVSSGEKGREASLKDGNAEDEKRKRKHAEDLQGIGAMPVVIIKNFESKGGGPQREQLLDVLSQWAASLVENHVAHVVVVSTNRENARRLSKALPSKPLNLIALSDADSTSALSFVKQKLHDVGIDVDFNSQQISYIQRIGGRASGLESLVHLVRSGMTVEEAVEDIITRGAIELRKNAFGDDLEDAKSLPWTREQAWTIMKQLTNKSEISYHELLLDFPFKGDDTALRNMEQAELIIIGTENGRPSVVKPGKPIHRYVFERLVHDSVFQATQDIAINAKLIGLAESTVRSCEAELLTLRDIDAGTSHWWGPSSAIRQRQEYLLKKMRDAEIKIENLEKQTANLKKVLARAS